MAANPEQLEKEANAEFEAMMQGPVESDTPESIAQSTAYPETSYEVANNPEPTPPANSNESADTDSGNWEERYKNLQAHATKVTQESSDLRRQLGMMQSQMSQLQQSQFQQSANTGAQQPDNLPEPDELDQVSEDFDELAPVVQELRALKKFQQDQSATAFMYKVAAAHPDHAQVYQSPEFQGWMQRLTGIERHGAQAAFSNQGTPEDVIDVFTRYKQSGGMGNKHDLAAQEAIPNPRSRSTPQTQTRPKFNWKQIQKMSNAEYRQREKEIDEAIMRGEVV